MEFFNEESLLRAIEKPIFVEGKSIKCSRAFLKQEAMKICTGPEAVQKLSNSQKTTDESKESPDSSFDLSLAQKKPGQPSGIKLKPKVKPIVVAETKSQKDDAVETCDKSASLGKSSPLSKEVQPDSWISPSTTPHKTSLDSFGMIPSHASREDDSRAFWYQNFQACNRVQQGNMYPSGNFSPYYDQFYGPSQSRLSYNPSPAEDHYPKDFYFGYGSDQSHHQSNSRTGGVIGQRFRGLSEHETMGSGPSSQWMAPGTFTQPGVFHHQGYSSYGWPQTAADQERVCPTSPVCSKATGSQRKGGQGKASSTYRMF